jgi:hypothetical protein
MKNKYGIGAFLICCFFFAGYAHSSELIDPKLTVVGDNHDVIEFLNHFEQAVLTGNVSKLMALMAPSYVREQHDQILEGRTEQFILEFFGGYFIDDKKVDGSRYYCYRLSQITAVTINKIENHGHGYGDENEISYTIWYTIEGDKGTMIKYWRLISVGEGFPGGLALVGAFG